MLGQYTLDQGIAGASRLEMLADLTWHISQQFLINQGFQKGMCCLDVGCGAGEISRRLLTLAGSDGSVTGIDIDPTSILMAKEKLSGKKNIHFKSFNLEHLKTNKFETRFDIIYCRFILCHIFNPLKLLKKLKSLLTNNGLIIVEDIDANTLFSIPENSDHDLFIHLHQQSMQLKNGNPHIGAQLHELLNTAGLHINGLSCYQLTGSQDRCKRFLLQTFQCMKTGFIENGLVSEPDYLRLFEALKKFYSRPDTLIGLPRCTLISGSPPG